MKKNDSTTREQRESDLNLLQLQGVQDIDIDQVVASFIEKIRGDCLLDLSCLIEKDLMLYVSG